MKDLIAQRFSRAASDYEAVTPAQQQSAQQLFAMLQPYLGHLNGVDSPVLFDVGVGSGRLLSLASKYLGAHWQFRGVDFAPQMLAQARRRFPHAQLHYGDAEHYHYLPNSYDLVISNFALQWCKWPAQLVQNLYAALRPSGLLAIALPVRGSLCRLAQLVWQIGSEPMPLYPLPTAKDFRRLAEPKFQTFQEQSYFVSYPSAYTALAAIKRAGAHTPAPLPKGAIQISAAGYGLSMRTLRLLKEETGPFELNYRVLFMLAQMQAIEPPTQ